MTGLKRGRHILVERVVRIFFSLTSWWQAEKAFRGQNSGQCLVFSILVGISLIFSGCAPKEEEWPSVSNPSAEWNLHEKALQTIDSWIVKGKVGVSDGVQAQSLNFSWTQQGQNYEIDFYGPLGVKVATLIKQKTEVSLLTSSGKKTAKDPESLMVEELGFSMPVSGLSQWVMGLPQSTTSPKMLNSFGYLSRLQEDGWDVSYISYQRRKGLGFPHQMILKRGNVRVVLSLERR
jgi:outer membrane lipoprotein LolB